MQKRCKGCCKEFETNSLRVLYCTSKCRKNINARKTRVAQGATVQLGRRRGKVARKPNKKGEYISESTKSCYDYWQG